MSHVTAVLLSFSEREEPSKDAPSPPLAEIMAWLRREDVGSLAALDELFGGWKHPGVRCFGGAFNHLDVTAFSEMFLQQEWLHPEQVVLMLTTEDEPALVIRPVSDG